MSDISTLRVIAREMFIKIDPKARVWSNNVLDAYINRGYMQVQKDGGNNRREQQDIGTFNTSGNINTYPLPSDFLKFVTVSCNNDLIDSIERADIYRANQIDATGTPIRYFVFGNTIGFYPIPQSSHKIDYLYNRKLSKITDDQGSELPDEFDFAICLYGAYLAGLSVEKRDKAMDMLGEYNQTISTLLTQYMLNQDRYTYGLDRGEPYLPSPRSL